MGPGVELVLRGGLHEAADTVVIERGGRLNRPALVRSAPGERAVVRCLQEAPALLAAAPFLRFEDLTFDGGGVGLEGILAHSVGESRSDALRILRCEFLNHRGSGLRLVPADGARIESCRFAFNGRSALDHGLYLESGDEIEVRGCVAEFNRGFGLHVYCDRSTEVRARSGRIGGRGIVLRNNLCRGNGDDHGDGCGIVVGGDYQDTLVENNVCFDNQDAGILIGYSDLTPARTAVRSNTCHRNGAAQIAIEQSSDTRVTDNLCDPGEGSGASVARFDGAAKTLFRGNFHAEGSPWLEGEPVGWDTWLAASGEILARRGRPAFREPGSDYRLLPGSDAIDAGSSIPVDFAQFDFDGVARPLGGAPDAGAFESA